MNLYEVNSRNINNVKYKYLIYADDMKFNEVGNAVKFYKEEVSIAIFKNYSYVLLLTDERFKIAYEGWLKYPGTSVETIMDAVNRTFLDAI